MRRKTVTAGELLERLTHDPVYQARRAKQDAELAARAEIFAADEAGLVQECRQLGYEIDSVWDFVNNSPHPVLPRRLIGPYNGAYETLVRHLGVKHHPRIREGIIRALTVRDGGEAVEIGLLGEFERERDQELRWVLANALKYAMPYSRRRKIPAIAEAYRAGMGV